MSINNSDLSHNNSNIWIISEGRYTDVSLEGVNDGKVAGPYKEYKISDIGRYLLNPNSIEVKKKLIGGEIHYKQGALKKIGRLFPQNSAEYLKTPEQGAVHIAGFDRFAL